MKVLLHPLADDEYWNELSYYSAVNAELGSRFTDSMDLVLHAISQNPFLCHNRGNGIFSVRIKGFPISVFYKFNSTYIFVIAVCHERRNPKIWKTRK